MTIRSSVRRLAALLAAALVLTAPQLLSPAQAKPPETKPAKAARAPAVVPAVTPATGPVVATVAAASLATAATAAAIPPVVSTDAAAQANATATSGARPATNTVKVADGRLLSPDIARIVNNKELVVAMNANDQPPFFYQRDGELVGLEVEMAQALAKALKVEVRFNRSAKNFNEVIDVLTRGEADVGISKLSRTLARAQVVRFSDPYLKLKHGLVLNRLAFASLARDKPVPQVVRNFNGSIGVIANSSFADFAASNFPKATVKTYKGWNDVVAAVRSGEVTAAYRDEFEIKRLLREDPTASLTLRTVTLKDLEDTLGIAVGAQDTTLLAFINQYLEQRAAKLDVESALQALGR